MLRTEHILYRAGVRQGSASETTNAVYDAFVSVLRKAVYSGAAIGFEQLGAFVLREGRLHHALSDESENLVPPEDFVDGVSREAQISVRESSSIIMDLVTQTADALRRRESVELRGIGSWDTRADAANLEFLPDDSTTDHIQSTEHGKSTQPEREVEIKAEQDVDNPTQPVAVDVRTIVAEVHREFGFAPPADTLDPSDIDVATLVRLVRNNMPELPDTLPPPTGLPASVNADVGSGESRPFIRSDSDATAGAAANSETPDEFEKNREQLYHPPAPKKRTSASLLALLLTALIAAMLVYVAWTNNLLDPFLPETLRHADHQADGLTTTQKTPAPDGVDCINPADRASRTHPSTHSGV